MTGIFYCITWKDRIDERLLALGLSSRLQGSLLRWANRKAKNRLERLTYEEVAESTDEELLEYPGFGKGQLAELRKAMVAAPHLVQCPHCQGTGKVLAKTDC